MENNKYFEIKTALDLFYKAQRDFEKLQIDLNTDNIFNFFVTCYHIIDYYKIENNISNNAEVVNKFKYKKEWEFCDILCNKGKHLSLTRNEAFKNNPNFKTNYYSGKLNGESLLDGYKTLNGNPDYLIINDDENIDPIDLGSKLLFNWKVVLGVT
jgi:hypothetical protein